MSSLDNVRGEIAMLPLSTVGEYEWEIIVRSDEIFETNSYLESPTFSFLHCSWCVRMFPKGRSSSSHDWISLLLSKKKSQFPKRFFCDLEMKFQGIGIAKKNSSLIFKAEEEDKGWDLYIPRKEVLDRLSEETIGNSRLTIKVKMSHSTFNEDPLVKVKMQETEILSQNYKDLLLHDEEHDLLLKVKDKEFKAHKNILLLRCPVFKLIISHEMLERNTGVVEIPDCDPSAFEQFLSYVYSGNIETTDESSMLGLYYIADKYDMSRLKTMCCLIVKNFLSARNVCDVIRLAMKHSDPFLLEIGTKYFVDNVKQVLVTTEWRCFNIENVVLANELLIKACIQ